MGFCSAKNIEQHIDIAIAEVNPLPRQRMNGVRSIAHQRQPRLNILQCVAAGEREGARAQRRNLSQPRREVASNFLL